MADIPLPEVHEGVFGKGTLPVVEGPGVLDELTLGDSQVAYADEQYGRAWQYRLQRNGVFGVVLIDSLTAPARSLTNFLECASPVTGIFASCGPVPNSAFASCGPTPNGSFGDDMSEATTELIYQILGGRPTVGDMLVGADNDLFELLPLGATNSVLKVGPGGPEWSDALTLATLNLGTLSLTTPLVWASVNKAGSSLADLATRSAADLSSGVLLDARVQASNVTQHQAALSIDWGQIVNEPATFPATPHAISDVAMHTGTLLHAQLPTGISGTWDVGNAFDQTYNAASHRFQVAGVPTVRISTTGISIDRTGVGFDALRSLHIKKATGSAVPDPVAIRLHTTTSAGDWGNAPWSLLEAWSDDVNTPGASVRGQLGWYSANAAGSQTGFGVWVGSGATFYKALDVNPANGAQSFIAPAGSNANMLGVINETLTEFVRFVGSIGGVAATEIIGELRFEPTVITPSPLEGSLVIRLNTGDNMQSVARFTRAGVLALASNNAAPAAGISQGIDVHNGSSTDHTQQFRGTGIAHGMTDASFGSPTTDTFYGILKVSGPLGGAVQRGFTESKQGIITRSYAVTDDLVRSTAGVAPVTLDARKRSGAGPTITAHANNANLVAITNNDSARYLFGVSSFFIAEALAAPTASATGGFLIWCDNAGLYARSPAGTVTTLALY